MRKHAVKILLGFLLLASVVFSLCSCSLFNTLIPTEVVLTTPFYPTLPPPVLTTVPSSDTATVAPTRTAIPYVTEAPPTNTSVPLLYRIEVNIAAQIVTVYRLSDGGIEKQFLCSSGATSTPTPLGSYTIQKRERWLEFPEFNAWGQYASNIVDDIWFHSITYKSKAPNAMNNTVYNQIGGRASHGCVRMLCSDCYWIYCNCADGTKVDIIAGTANPELNASLKSQLHLPIPKVYDSSKSAYVYWDPSDPDTANPWKQDNPKTSPTLAPVV